MNKLILLVIMFIANMTFGQTDKAAENVTNRMSSAMELTDQERSEVLKLVTERNFQRKTLKEKFGDDEAGFKIAVKEIEVSFNRKLREYVGNKKMKLWADFNSASKENEKELQNNNQDDILINLSIKMQEVMGLSDNEKEKAFDIFKQLAIIAPENVTETPLSFGPQPLASFSGSDHTKSHKSPD